MAIVKRLKSRLLSALPSFVTTPLKILREVNRLRKIGKLSCDAQRLRSQGDLASLGLFGVNDADMGWSEAKKEIDKFAIPDATQRR
jgi:hypothetical protein